MMESKMKSLAYMALMMAALAQSGESMYKGPRIRTIQAKPAKGLPRWDVGGNTIFAKNERDAIKYARKRGLYRDGMEAIRIDE